MTAELYQQIDFILEIDKLKRVNRRSYLLDGSRTENTAEHSWHVAVAAMLLAPDDGSIDIFRVIKMLLVHDIVEIDAGDTFLYDTAGTLVKAAQEQKAADRLFTMLPPRQAQELRSLWDEFEERSTPDAKFARGLDRLMPLLHNYYTQGKTWREHDVTADKVLAQNSIINDASQELWRLARRLIDDAVDKGWLQKEAERPQ